MDPGGAPVAFAAPVYGGQMGGRAVPAGAPPLFLAIAQDDRLLLRSVEGVYAAWMAADRPVEFHLFARGGHGFGMTPRGVPTDKWVDMFGDWLVDQGFG
jgi:acetyl esterase/lipase